MGGGREGAGVADVDEDAGSGPDPDAWHRDQDLRKRMGLQEFLDPCGEEFALVKDGYQLSGQAGDNQRGRGRMASSWSTNTSW